jgi:hypothetical protein
MDWAAFGSLATGAGPAATAAAVWSTRRQLRLSQQQARSGFEDELEREYRQIIAQLPVGALLGERLPAPVLPEVLAVFYRYIDLTNRQVFLRGQDRITDATWTSWRAGIAHQLRRPAFQSAWAQLKDTVPEDFHELQRLEATGFIDDPRGWPEQSTVNGGGSALASTTRSAPAAWQLPPPEGTCPAPPRVCNPARPLDSCLVLTGGLQRPPGDSIGPATQVAATVWPGLGARCLWG